MNNQNFPAYSWQERTNQPLSLKPFTSSRRLLGLEWEIVGSAWKQGWGAAWLDEPLRSLSWASLQQSIRDRNQLRQMLHRLCYIEQAKQELTKLAACRTFHALAEPNQLAIFLYQNEQLRYVNPAVESVSGYTREELLAMGIWDLIDASTLPRLCRLHHQQKPVFLHDELALLTKDGNERSLDLIVTSIAFEGHPALLGTALDRVAMPALASGDRPAINCGLTA